MMLVSAGIVAVAATYTVSAAQHSKLNSDPIEALLGEVHSLRMAMEQSATIAPRVQLTLARLNIEEQRISQLVAQLDRARQDLTHAHGEWQKMRDELADAEKSLPIETDEQRRRGFEFGIAELKTRMKRQSGIEEQLRLGETEAMQNLSTEQSRWIDLNSRLDELERLLAPVPVRRD